jgi:hypothetical protein
MLTGGVPLKLVSEILGHSSIAITGDIYGHVSPTSPAGPRTCSARHSTGSPVALGHDCAGTERRLHGPCRQLSDQVRVT